MATYRNDDDECFFEKVIAAIFDGIMTLLAMLFNHYFGEKKHKSAEHELFSKITD